MNKYMFSIAERAACAALDYDMTNINPKWLYAQFAHETAQFTSELMQSNHNLGGLCQSEPNDTKQPDGDQYYINFPSFEAYADYFGHYLRYYKDAGIDKATTLEEYITALKKSPSGAYFGDSLENYLANTERIYAEEFA